MIPPVILTMLIAIMPMTESLGKELETGCVQNGYLKQIQNIYKKNEDSAQYNVNKGNGDDNYDV